MTDVAVSDVSRHRACRDTEGVRELSGVSPFLRRKLPCQAFHVDGKNRQAFARARGRGWDVGTLYPDIRCGDGFGQPLWGGHGVLKQLMLSIPH